MYMDSILKRSLILAGAAVLAVVALVAWTAHKPAAQPLNTATQYGNPEPVSNVPDPAVVVPGTMNEYGEPANLYRRRASAEPGACGPGTIVCAASPFGASQPTTMPPRTGFVSAYSAPPPVAASVPPVERAYIQRPYYRRYYYRRGRRVVVVKRRPFRRSAEIVAGSAGGGALVGALAGGGKGAGIGALAAGAGGLIYDRATHKKEVVVDR